MKKLLMIAFIGLFSVSSQCSSSTVNGVTYHCNGTLSSSNYFRNDFFITEVSCNDKIVGLFYNGKNITNCPNGQNGCSEEDTQKFKQYVKAQQEAKKKSSW